MVIKLWQHTLFETGERVRLSFPFPPLFPNLFYTDTPHTCLPSLELFESSKVRRSKQTDTHTHTNVHTQAHAHKISLSLSFSFCTPFCTPFSLVCMCVCANGKEGGKEERRKGGKEERRKGGRMERGGIQTAVPSTTSLALLNVTMLIFPPKLHKHSIETTHAHAHAHTHTHTHTHIHTGTHTHTQNVLSNTLTSSIPA